MRRTGKTTRTVDKAIQVFFEDGGVFFPEKRGVKEEALKGLIDNQTICIFDVDWKTPIAQRHMVKTFLKRLSFEHDMTYTGEGLPLNKLITIEDFK